MIIFVILCTGTYDYIRLLYSTYHLTGMTDSNSSIPEKTVRQVNRDCCKIFA